ncbi:MAG: DNA repair protein RecO [Acidobacteria bacterium]|nr:DNA repair protein RecO [Acidobacteriota bacterium]
MPARESEAFVLRSYPYREADLIVSFFSRDLGKLRGIARGVRRPKSRFGASLERLSHSRISYFQKDNLELVRIDRGELLSPAPTMRVDYGASVALDLIAEISDELLPEHEPQDAHFRLLTHVLERVVAAAPDPGSGPSPDVQRALTYFQLWTLRLAGLLPPFGVCLETGEELEPDEPAYFERSSQGLFRAERKTSSSWLLSPASRRLAQEMLKRPLSEVPAAGWTAHTADDLRRYLVQRLEAHIEKRLRAGLMLAAL